MVIDTSAIPAFLGCLAGSGQAELDLLLSRAQITPVPLDDLHVHWALQAPLLFKGTDFAATDLEAAVISLG